MIVHNKFNSLVESQVSREPFNHCLAVALYKGYFYYRALLWETNVKLATIKIKGQSRINSDVVVNYERSRIDNVVAVFYLTLSATYSTNKMKIRYIGCIKKKE